VIDTLADRPGAAQRRRSRGCRGRAAWPVRGADGIDRVGDPQAALLWVSRSQRHLAGQLTIQGYRVDHTVVRRLLEDMGFSLQANANTREDSQHP
jgi:hypothetical protein